MIIFFQNDMALRQQCETESMDLWNVRPHMKYLEYHRSECTDPHSYSCEEQ